MIDLLVVWSDVFFLHNNRDFTKNYSRWMDVRESPLNQHNDKNGLGLLEIKWVPFYPFLAW